LPELLSLIERPNQLGFWVNYHNQYSAYAALALMQQLDSVEFKQQLILLKAQVKVFESKAAVRLRGNIN
jgi:hypothetical protein